MSERATRLIESAMSGTLPADLVRDMIYQGKLPNDFPPLREERKLFRVLAKSDKGTYGLSDFDKEDEAKKDAQKRSKTEKGTVIVVKKGNPRPLATFKAGEPVRESLSESLNEARAEINWPDQEGTLVKTGEYWEYKRKKGHGIGYRGPDAKEKMRYALRNQLNIPGKMVDVAIKKVEGNGKNESVDSEAVDFIAQARSFLEKCKIPPQYASKQDNGKKSVRESNFIESAELNEGEAAFMLDTPEHMTQLEELVTNLSAAQVPFSMEEVEETGEIILSWPEGYGQTVEATMEALGITTYDDTDLTPEAGVDYLPYQHLDVKDSAMEAAQTLTGQPKGNLPSLFKPVGEVPKKKENEKKKKPGLLAKIAAMVQRAHGAGNVPSSTASSIPATEQLTADDLINLRLQGNDIEDIIDEVSNKALLARFGDKRAKPFKGDR